MLSAVSRLFGAFTKNGYFSEPPPLTEKKIEANSALKPLPIDFLSAIQKKDKESVSQMLKEDPTLATLSSPFRSPLKVAIWDSPNDEIATVLLDAGATADDQFQLFYHACQSGLAKTVKKMMDKGLNFSLHTRSVRGYTPLQATLLIESPESHAMRLETARKLLEKDPSIVDEKGLNGCTALHIAAKLGDSAFVKLLLEFEADREIVDKYGNTALALAKHGNHFQTAQLLSEQVFLAAIDPNRYNRGLSK